jgi:hypothetical protein
MPVTLRNGRTVEENSGGTAYIDYLIPSLHVYKSTLRAINNNNSILIYLCANLTAQRPVTE